MVTASLALLVGLRACVFRPGGDAPGPSFNRGTNAAWLNVEWVNQPHTDTEIDSLADSLVALQIRDVFAYASYLRTGNVFGEGAQHAAAYVARVKAHTPQLRIQAWIGLPLRSIGGTVDLRDPATRDLIADFCRRLIRDAGFAGIHLDPEIVGSGDPDIITLLKAVRVAIGPAALLSVAVPVGWSASYLREVAATVDQIAVMSYDSSLPIGVLYAQWLRFVTITTTAALRGWDGNLFIGLPTSEEWTPTHIPAGENIRAAFDGLILGLNDAEAAPGVLTGVAIYPFWETSADEWQVYRTRWLGN